LVFLRPLGDRRRRRHERFVDKRKFYRKIARRYEKGGAQLSLDHWPRCRYDLAKRLNFYRPWHLFLASAWAAAFFCYRCCEKRACAPEWATETRFEMEAADASVAATRFQLLCSDRDSSGDHGER
jgi:hypothetical protein